MAVITFGEDFTGEVLNKDNTSNNLNTIEETKPKPVDNSMGVITFGEAFDRNGSSDRYVNVGTVGSECPSVGDRG